LWYTQAALRAVNQAIGRVIRHSSDYGAVLLADERFAFGSIQPQLSLWLRPLVQSPASFTLCTASLQQFFRENGDGRLAPRAQPPLPREPPPLRAVVADRPRGGLEGIPGAFPALLPGCKTLGR